MCSPLWDPLSRLVSPVQNWNPPDLQQLSKPQAFPAGSLRSFRPRSSLGPSGYKVGALCRGAARLRRGCSGWESSAEKVRLLPQSGPRTLCRPPALPCLGLGMKRSCPSLKFSVRIDISLLKRRIPFMSKVAYNSSVKQNTISPNSEKREAQFLCCLHCTNKIRSTDRQLEG